MSKLISPSNVLGSYYLPMSDSFWEELHKGVILVKDRIRNSYIDYLTDDCIIKVNVLVNNSEFESNNLVKKISFQVMIEENGIDCPFVAWLIKKNVHHLYHFTEFMS